MNILQRPNILQSGIEPKSLIILTLPKQEYEWTRTVYGNIKEEIPKDIPKSLGKRVITTTFLDANLLHDIVTGNLKSQLYYTLSTPPQ